MNQERTREVFRRSDVLRKLGSIGVGFALGSVVGQYLESPQTKRPEFRDLLSLHTLLRFLHPPAASAATENQQTQEVQEQEVQEWGLTDDEIALVKNDGAVWHAPDWYPFDPGYARRIGLQTLHEGPLFIHDFVLKDPAYAGTVGFSRDWGYEEMEKRQEEFPNAQSWLGHCELLAAASILYKEPPEEEVEVAGLQITKGVRVGLLIATLVGYPPLGFNMETVEARADRFLRTGRSFIVAYQENDGWWFGAVKGVEGKTLIVTNPYIQDKPVAMSRIQATYYLKPIEQKTPFAPYLKEWQEKNRVKGLDHRMVFHLAYGLPYKTGA